MVQAHDDAAHIANCDPDTIMALCAAVEAAQQVACAFDGDDQLQRVDTLIALSTALQPFKKD